jgi:hypothetical protein
MIILMRTRGHEAMVLLEETTATVTVFDAVQKVRCYGKSIPAVHISLGH